MFCFICVDSCDTQYGFSMFLHHGGFFLGSGVNLGYVGGREAWVDHIPGDKWCFKDIEDIVEGLGYEMAGRFKVYFCMPGVEMSKGGLVDMKSDEETDHNDEVICGLWEEVFACLP